MVGMKNIQLNRNGVVKESKERLLNRFVITMIKRGEISTTWMPYHVCLLNVGTCFEQW